MTPRLGGPKLKQLSAQKLQITRLQNRLQNLLDEGFDVVQVDECLFNSDHNRGRHWAPAQQPFQITKKYLNQPKIVVLGAISKLYGNVHYQFGEFSFKTADVINFLQGLRKKYIAGQKLAVFWDNCSIHLSWFLKEWLKLHDPDLQLVYNIAYRPDLNGIESLWLDCKTRYRARLDNYKANCIEFQHQALVEDIVGDTLRTTAIRCAR